MSLLALVALAPLACTPAGTDPDDSAGDVDTADPADTADSGTAPFFSADAVERIEKRVNADLDGALATGVQIAVWHDGAVVWTGSYGTKNPDSDEPVDDHTLFQIGSDTKKMTALAALQQVQAGTLSLDDTVADVRPAVSLAKSPDWAGNATLHDLLSHQGGLFDYTPWVDAPDDSQLAAIAEGEFSTGAWAMTEPGTFYNYANPNFSIAGLLVETAGGKPWADLVEDGIFAPLGMEETFARETEVEAYGDYAVGTGPVFATAVDPLDPLSDPDYTLETISIEDTVDNAFTRPAGMVWSTATDQATFCGFWIEGNAAVVGDDLRALATTEHVPDYPSVPIQGYGYGWEVVNPAVVSGKAYATPFWLHGGNTLSMSSLTWVFPEKGLAISILSNGFGDDFNSTAATLLTAAGGLGDPTDLPDLATTESDHARLTGDYVDAFLGELRVTDEEGTLVVDVPTLDTLGVAYTPELTFGGYQDIYLLTVDGETYDVTFIADDTGTYRWLRNRGFVGERSEALRAPDAPMPTRAALLRHLAEARVNREGTLVGALLPLTGR